MNTLEDFQSQNEDILWEIDEVHQVLPGMRYNFNIPTFIPEDWYNSSHFRKINQKKYSFDFCMNHKIAYNILKNYNLDNSDDNKGTKIVVAGDAAASPYYDNDHTCYCIDIYIIGAREKLWRKVKYIYESIKYYSCMEEYNITQEMRPGEITFIIKIYDKVSISKWILREYKYKILLKTYPTILSLLQTFVVGSCCIAYDGDTTYMTSMGVFSQLFRVNLVDEEHFDGMEKYFAKYYYYNYAIGFVLKHNKYISEEFYNMKMILWNQIERNKLSGKIIFPMINCCISQNDEEYNNHINLVRTVQSIHEDQDSVIDNLYTIITHNTQQLVMTGNEYCVNESPEGDPIDVMLFDGVSFPFNKWEEKTPNLPDFVSRSSLEAYLSKYVKKLEKNIKIKSLITNFGMSKEEVIKFTEKIYDALDKDPENIILHIKPYLQYYVERVLNYYDIIKDEIIEWWLHYDPSDKKSLSHLASSSHQNIISTIPPSDELTESDESVAYVNSIPVEKFSTSYLISKSILNNDGILWYYVVFPPQIDIAPRGVTKSCALCLNTIFPGRHNTINLPCGHMFHWEYTYKNNCLGIHKLFTRDKTTCPLCRQSFFCQFNTSDCDYDKKCGKCKKDINSKEKGIVNLKCGHSYHWEEFKEQPEECIECSDKKKVMVIMKGYHKQI